MTSKNKEVRKHIIRIRLSDAEREKLKENSEGCQVSPWLRELGLGTQPSEIPKPARSRKPPPTVDPLLIREISRIGNNLNQLARTTNEQKKGGFDFDALDVLGKLEAMHDELRRLREVHDDR